MFVASLPFLSCCSSSPSRWDLETTTTSGARYNSARLTLPHDILTIPSGLQLCRGRQGWECYAYTVNRPFPARDDNAREADSVITIDGEDHPVVVHLLQGGQRALLPHEWAEKIVDALLDGKECSMQIGYHRLSIPHDGFASQWQKLCAVPMLSV